MNRLAKVSSSILVVLSVLGGSLQAKADPEYACRETYRKKIQRLEKRKSWAFPAAIAGGAAGVGIAGAWKFYNGGTGQMESGWQGEWNLLHVVAAGGLAAGLGSAAYSAVREPIERKQQNYSSARLLLDLLDASYAQIFESQSVQFVAQVKGARVRELQQVNQGRRARGERELSLNEWLERYPLPVFKDSDLPTLTLEVLVPEGARGESGCTSSVSRGDCYEWIRRKLLDLRATDAFCPNGKPLRIQDVLKTAFSS